jgi:hypothetical protein
MEHKDINQQQELINKIIWRFLEQNKELILKKIIGYNGLILTAESDKNIDLNTYGIGKVLYNGTEIGTTSGTVKGTGTAQGIAIWTAADTIGVGYTDSDISFYGSTGVKFYQGSPGTFSGEIRNFSGIHAYDFKVRSVNGVLYLEGGAGINIASSLVADLGMGGYKITNLGAPSAVTDAARYKDGFVICTSSTRPASPTEGMHIYETDTDKDYKCTVGGATPTWVEVGGAGISGTQNKLAKFLAGGVTVGNSSITDDGSVVTITEDFVLKANGYTGTDCRITNDASGNPQIKMGAGKGLYLIRS